MSLARTIASRTVAFGGLPDAVLRLEIDPAEHARRQAVGIGPVTGYGFGGLGTLGSLPENLPVPLAALTPAQREYVSQVPAGICTVSRDHVTRHAIRACQVTLAEITAPMLGRLAFDAAGSYRQFTAVAVRIGRRRPRTDDWLDRFARAGIGVFLDDGDRTVTLARPRPRLRATLESWWLAEAAYAAWLHREEPRYCSGRTGA
ncbi:hypothetical protein ACFQ7J_14250 [Streptomyces sp. NPDC056501]|uniref:hypothetical protein n=1 Tax=Streptomyces sp. NPDC056501 TaxID=3345841 RepID=UPI0036BC7AF6